MEGAPIWSLPAPGVATQSGLLDELADATLADRTRMQFEPMVMAQDLAACVELLAAAIEAIPADLLNPSDAE